MTIFSYFISISISKVETLISFDQSICFKAITSFLELGLGKLVLCPKEIVIGELSECGTFVLKYSCTRNYQITRHKTKCDNFIGNFVGNYRSFDKTKSCSTASQGWSPFGLSKKQSLEFHKLWDELVILLRLHGRCHIPSSRWGMKVSRWECAILHSTLIE